MEDLVARFRDQARNLADRRVETRRCSVQGCPNDYYCRDLCHTHHKRYKEFGNPLAKRPVHPKQLPVPKVVPCTWDGCSNLTTGLGKTGLCSTHKARLYSGIPMDLPITPGKRGRKPTVPGIPDEVRAGSSRANRAWSSGKKPTKKDKALHKLYTRMIRERRRSDPSWREEVKEFLDEPEGANYP